MKPCHVAALALVGWYMRVRPLVGSSKVTNKQGLGQPLLFNELELFELGLTTPMAVTRPRAATFVQGSSF